LPENVEFGLVRQKNSRRAEIYSVNGSVSGNETYDVWITVNAPPEPGNVANGTGNTTPVNSTATVMLANASVSGTITIEEIGDPINGTEDIGNRTGLDTDTEPVKGANVTVNGSIEAALKDMGGYARVKPAASKATTPAAEGAPTTAPAKGAPGFTAVFAICMGCLAVAYAMMRRRG